MQQSLIHLQMFRSVIFHIASHFLELYSTSSGKSHILNTYPSLSASIYVTMSSRVSYIFLYFLSIKQCAWFIDHVFINVDWTKEEIGFISCTFSPFSTCAIESRCWRRPRGGTEVLRSQKEAQNVASSSHSAWTPFSLHMGCWLMIHVFLYYSWHTEINPLPFLFSCTFFLLETIPQKSPLLIISIMPLKSVHCILSLLFFPLHF